MTDGKLTPEQIANWRRVLVGMIGLYALIASDEEIQAFRDKMQAHVSTQASVEQCDALEAKA